MIKAQILPFIKDFIDSLSIGLQEKHPSFRLTNIQKLWLSFCITGIILTNSVCWARFERVSFGGWTIAALSWMFRRSKLDWDKLLKQGISTILNKYDITWGCLELDDTERERSKNAKYLHHLGKQKDKKSGGYFTGQSILFLLLVTEKLSIPVGFAFYKMDPELKAWQEQEKRLKRQRVKKSYRPKEPIRNALYPTKNELGLGLVKDFEASFSHIKIKAVKADALYGTASFVDGVADIYPNTQVISQIRRNQKIQINGVSYSVGDYFKQRAAIKSSVVIRGGKSQSIYYSSVIAKVQAHKKKRLIIALKYEGETNFRYIIAQNMTWRVQDVLQCSSFRWLVEVFFQDWKMYEGWGQMTKHVGAEGARRSLCLSLLLDLCLLSHPQQAARIKDKLPLYTVGSLRDKLSMQSLLQCFEYILNQPNPKQYLEKLTENVEQVYKLRQSSKHMSGRKVRLDTG